MKKSFMIPKRSRVQHRETLKIKKCAFPGCQIEEAMTGRARYCKEHRKRKYRKIIDAAKIEAKKAEEEARNPNQIIKHNYVNPTIMKMKCKLEGCDNEFEIKIFPNTYIYPKYCNEHRNEHKRNMFITSRKV